MALQGLAEMEIRSSPTRLNACISFPPAGPEFDSIAFIDCVHVVFSNESRALLSTP